MLFRKPEMLSQQTTFVILDGFKIKHREIHHKIQQSVITSEPVFACVHLQILNLQIRIVTFVPAAFPSTSYKSSIFTAASIL